ncbi:MAG TPA: NADPH-dependent FMN reductase [Phycicoccus sp.]|nr:NADPH-dependent FMN reductase [Phycicoccus sp.]
MNVLVLVGSLRTGSLNRRLADAALAHLASGDEATIFDGLAELPHYSPDLDVTPLPPAAARLRAAVEAAGAVLVVTPEYNGSLPSAVKNAIDWASRPRGEAVLAGKPAAVLAASGAPRAARWAREDAVRILRVAGAEVAPDTVGVGTALDAFAGGRLSDTALDEAVARLVGRLTEQADATRAA